MEPELGKDGGPVNGDPPPQARPAALVFIFITLMLDMLALGMIVPVLPKLVEDFVHGDTARASYVVGVFGTVRALMQFVSGTRRAFRQLWATSGGVLSNFGLGLDYIVMVLAPTVWWLFAGRVISGITSASFSVASAYVADVTPPRETRGAFGRLSAAIGLGFVLGPALGGGVR
jgi:DHA1 family tetracycline resistance protein-like MFS transporter